jgi:hypothetical protein
MKMILFHQDRLGTNIGKTQERTLFSCRVDWAATLRERTSVNAEGYVTLQHPPTTSSADADAAAAAGQAAGAAVVPGGSEATAAAVSGSAQQPQHAKGKKETKAVKLARVKMVR